MIFISGVSRIDRDVVLDTLVLFCRRCEDKNSLGLNLEKNLGLGQKIFTSLCIRHRSR